jgi:hypothetical protein
MQQVRLVEEEDGVEVISAEVLYVRADREEEGVFPHRGSCSARAPWESEIVLCCSRDGW